MSANSVVISLTLEDCIKITKWKVKEGTIVSVGRIILLYEPSPGNGKPEVQKLKATAVGTVRKLLVKEGDVIRPGDLLLELEKCTHPTVMKDMCAECGADLRNEEAASENAASIPMVHSVPELKVNAEQAQILGKADEERLLANKKLVLLVDLDQTLIHTTNDNIPPNLKDVYHFRLHGSMSQWHHTRLRPGTKDFLKEMSQYYELHICTFGSRMYAHTIADFLDPDKQYFSHRILSRDECFSANSKTANLRALFPCGDNMVCIIDDREDVWNYAPNLIHVKPYHFFQHTGDINAPPGLAKRENDDKGGYDFSCLGDGRKGKDDSLTNIHESEKDSQKDAINLIKRKDGEVGLDNKQGADDRVDSKNKVFKEKLLKDKPTTEDLASMEIQIDSSGTEISGHSATETKQISGVFGEKNGFENKLTMTKDPLDSKEIPVENQLENISSTGVVSNSVESKPCDEIKKQDKSSENEVSSTQNPERDESQVLEEENDKNETILPIGTEAAFKEIDVVESENEVSTTLETKLLEPDMDEKETEKASPDSSSSAPVKEDLSSTKLSDGSDRAMLKTDEIEVEDHDDYLLYLEEILKRIHKEFYSRLIGEQKPDMKEVVPAVRKKVLEGTNIVFSGLVPNNIPLERSRAYQVAVSLGANVTQDLQKNTTHLVAMRPGTAKVNSARRMKNVFLVAANWLWVCAERWERVDEKVFPLGKSRAGTRHPPAHCGSPEHSPGASSEPTTSSGRSRTASGRFMDTINPLLSFSSADIADMDQEVNDIFNESESDGEDEGSSQKERKPTVPEQESESEDSELPNLPLAKAKLEEDSDSSSSSADSLSGEHPHGWGKHNLKRKRPDYAPGTGTATESDGDEETDDMPSTKFRRGEALPSDLDLGENESESPGSEDPPDEMDDGDWNMMGAALEREFLS